MRSFYNHWTGRFVGLMCLATSLSAGADSNDGVAAQTRSLSFYHTHTGATLEIEYWRNGEYLDEALVHVNGFLSDWRNGQSIEIDPALMDALFQVREAVGGEGSFEVISAFRSP